MLNFFRSKPSQPPQPDKEYVSALKLSDGALVDLLREMFEQQHVDFGALFLVGDENWPVYYGVFCDAVNKDAEGSKTSPPYPPTIEGYVEFLAAAKARLQPGSADYEIGSRRILYLYLASLLRLAHRRASEKPELWDSVAEIWVALLPGARKLREVIDRTRLWGTEESIWFRDLRTEEDGEHYCLAHMAPPEIRYHKKVEDWLEKDLPPDVIASLREIDKHMGGE
jgi:hypothetical protein